MLKLFNLIVAICATTAFAASAATFDCNKKCTRFTTKEAEVKDCLTNCRTQPDKIKNFMLKFIGSDKVISWDDMAKAYLGDSPLTLEEREKLKELGKEAGKESNPFYEACIDVSIDLWGNEGLKSLLTESDGPAIWKQNFGKILKLVDFDEIQKFLKDPENGDLGERYLRAIFEKKWGISLSNLGHLEHFFEDETLAPSVSTPEALLATIKPYKPDQKGRDEETLNWGRYTLVGAVDDVRAYGDPEFYARVFSQDDSLLAKALVTVEKEKRGKLRTALLQRNEKIKCCRASPEHTESQENVANVKLDFDKFLRAALLLHLKKYELSVFIENMREGLKDVPEKAYALDPDSWCKLVRDDSTIIKLKMNMLFPGKPFACAVKAEPKAEESKAKPSEKNKSTKKSSSKSKNKN